MKKLIVLASSTLLALTVSASAFAAHSGSLGVVNVQQILEKSPRVKQLNENLRKQFAPQQKELEADQKALHKDLSQLKRNGSVMSKSEKSKLNAKIKTAQAGFIKKASLFQSKLRAAQQNVMKQVFVAMSSVIAQVAKKDHLSVVLDSQAVAYRDPNVDISSQVAKEFNSQKS